jgi:hypothetical protein
MKKILTSVFLMLLFSSAVFSQIDDIKKKSDDNKKNGNHSGNENTGGSPGDPCVSQCAGSAFELVFDVAVQSLAKYNNYLLENSKDPEIISLEALPQLGYGIHFSNDQQNVYKYYDILPRLRGNLGAFSMEARLDYLFEANDSTYFNSFPVWNYWIGINIIPKDLFRLTIGQGIMYESNSQQAFHETYVGADIPIKNRLFVISPEVRFAYDYQNGIFPYIESGVRGSYRFLDVKRFSAYFTAGAAWRNYYQSHEVALVYGGLTLCLHKK